MDHDGRTAPRSLNHAKYTLTRNPTLTLPCHVNFAWCKDRSAVLPASPGKLARSALLRVSIVIM